MERGVLSGKEALNLAAQGKKNWNEWAESNPGCKVSFAKVRFYQSGFHDLSFSGFVFPGDVDFSHSKFSRGLFDSAIFQGDADFSNAAFVQNATFQDAVFFGGCDFHRAEFLDDVGFQRAEFEKPALLLAAKFERHLSLSGAKFRDEVNFLGAAFIGSISFEGCYFASVPDLRRSEFRKHVTFHEMSLVYRQPPHKDDSDKYRRLKELAVAGRDHDKEQLFFAYELRAKRGFEVTGLGLLPSYAYEIMSDFGRSVRRPFGFLTLVWFLFGLAYTLISEKSYELGNGLLYSLNILFSFIPGSLNRTKLIEAQTFPDSVPIFVNFLTLVEGLLGIVLVFLFVLAIRNRFRV